MCQTPVFFSIFSFLVTLRLWSILRFFFFIFVLGKNNSPAQQAPEQLVHLSLPPRPSILRRHEVLQFLVHGVLQLAPLAGLCVNVPPRLGFVSCLQRVQGRGRRRRSRKQRSRIRKRSAAERHAPQSLLHDFFEQELVEVRVVEDPLDLFLAARLRRLQRCA